MTDIMIRLDEVVKLLSFGDFPNKQELFKAFENLKKIFNHPVSSESFPEIISALKSNLFYRQFELDGDPEFLKALVNKIHNFEVIEKILLAPSKINYSQTEEIVLKQRRNMLFSLALVEKDLKELGISGNENQPDLDDFFDVYFDNLEELKKMTSSKSISIDNIDWFLRSDLFELVLENSDYFDVKLTDLYEILLANTEIKTKKDFITHKQLLEKVLNENNYKEFYNILSKNKKQLSQNLRTYHNIPIAINSHNIFKKIPNLKLSPMTKKALINSLKNYKDSPYVSFKC